MISAAKEEIASGSRPWCADLPLAADPELAENSRPGIGQKNAALHLGQPVCNSTTALGIERGLVQKSFGSLIQSLNRYAYATNSPVNRVDRTGLYNEPDDSKANFWLSLFNDGGCTIDGVASPCSSASDLLDGGGGVQYDGPMVLPGGWIFVASADGSAGFVPMGQGESALNISIVNAVARRIAENAANAFLGILQGDNGCSSYFNSSVEDFSGGFDSLAAPIFQSVSIRLNTAQDPSIGAQTQQGQGINSTIFLNPVGPFYRAFGLIDGQMKSLPSVGPYNAGTVRAQVTVLAHEFGHDINAIPSDTGNREQSLANTQTIVSHCGTAINHVRN